MQPEKLSPYLKNLIDRTDSPALKRQFLPSEDEKILSPYDTGDPLAEERFSLTPFLVHRYPDRALWLTTPQCAAACRYCFRKHRLCGAGEPTEADVNEACACLKSRLGIEEILLSGGDPLTLSDERLTELLHRFSSVRPFRFRICTRIPTVAPQRITDALLRALRLYRVRFSVHINCADELTEDAVAALREIRSAGFEILTQTVLLRGVNDSEKELSALFKRFSEMDLTPYYLFQGDLAAETAAYRVSIQTGRRLYRRVRQRLYRGKIPRYAVDLPDGGGKVCIEADRIAGVRGRRVLFRSDSGRLFAYPIE